MSDSPANLFKPFDEIERMIGECFEIVRREQERCRNAENANRRKEEFLAAETKAKECFQNKSKNL